MAVVRPITENSVQPQAGPQSRLQPAEHDAGRIIARAVTRMGAAGMQAGEDLHQIRLRDAETAARDADNQATLRRTQLLHEGDNAFYNQRGRNALNALPQVQTEMERIDREIEAELTDPFARQMYRDAAGRRRAAESERIARHASTERERYEESVFTTSVATATSQAVAGYNDPAEVEAQIVTVRNLVAQRSQRLGITDEASITQLQNTRTAEMIGEIAERMRLDSPAEAQAFVVAQIASGRVDGAAATDILNQLDDEAAAETASEQVQNYIVYDDEVTPTTGAAPGVPGERIENYRGTMRVYTTDTARPVADATAVLRQVYPGINLNSHVRPGDTDSWHGRSRAAIDINPIPGVTFAQFVQSFRNRGYQIIEALEEVGPGRTPQATGDHWHIVLGNPAPGGAARGSSGNVRPTPVPANRAMHAAIQAQETGGERNPDAAVSSAGAIGRMQTLPTTLADPGYGVTPARNRSPEEMARVGRDYYDAMLRHYGGNVVLALAAYNAGPGNVDQWIQQFGDPRRGQISDGAWLARVPARETRDYVPGVLRRVGVTISTSANSPSAQPRAANSAGPEATGEPLSQVNLEATIARIEADPELTWTQKQALIAAANRTNTLRRDSLSARQDNLAQRASQEMIQLGNSYTSYDQLSLPVRQELSRFPELELRFRGIAETNAARVQQAAQDAAEPDPYSPQYLDLIELANGSDQEQRAFLQQDVRTMPGITPGERAGLIERQRVVRERLEGGQQNHRVAMTQIRQIVRTLPASRSTGLSNSRNANEEQRRNRLLLEERLRIEVERVQNRENRRLGTDEILGIANELLEPVTIRRANQPGWFGARTTTEEQVPLYRQRQEMNEDRPNSTTVIPGVPQSDINAITQSFRAQFGTEPSIREIIRIYRDGQSR